MGSNNRAFWSQLLISIKRNAESRNYYSYVNLKSAIANRTPFTYYFSCKWGLTKWFWTWHHIYKLELSKEQELWSFKERGYNAKPLSENECLCCCKIFFSKNCCCTRIGRAIKNVTFSSFNNSILLPTYWQVVFYLCIKDCQSRYSIHPHCLIKLFNFLYFSGITCRNKLEKFEFLAQFVKLIQNIKIGNGWKPLNGMILSTLSLCNITEMLIENKYKFVTHLHKMPWRMFSHKYEENLDHIPLHYNV